MARIPPLNAVSDPPCGVSRTKRVTLTPMAGPAPADLPVTDQDALPPVVILSDDPTAEDELGQAHLRVAKAIATLIRQGADSGRSIALTGSWGSGKSSVIKMLSSLVEDPAEPDSGPSVFLFDAWAHQGDPLRRAFLERMIERLSSIDPAFDHLYWSEKTKRKISFREECTKELDLITGRRETSESHAERPLTNWGLWVAMTLVFCIPLASSVAAKFDVLHLKETWWFAPLALISLLAPIALGAIAWKKEKTPDVWRALFLREAHQDTSTTTVKTKEPSSVDFQRLFADLAGFFLNRGKDRRLIVVIDNLDRIDAASAVSMWATMRIFFELDHRADAWKNHVWLIVPFDRSALSGLWQSIDGKQAVDFVDSFLHKTFQLTFHVSPAVLTAWKDYFSKRLAKAFPGKEQEPERNAVFELFALKRTSPSPREINIFINKVSALRLQWYGAPAEDRIELPFLAAYVLHQDKIGVDGSGLLTGDVLSHEAVNILWRYKPNADCGGKLAAAHFNVSPDEAIQVLIGNRFSEALAAGKGETLGTLRKSANFWTVLERYSSSQLSAWQESPGTLSRVIKFLDASEAEEKEAAASISRIWPTALRAATATIWGKGIDQDRADAFPLLLRRSAGSSESFQAIAHRMLEFFATGPSPDPAPTVENMTLLTTAIRNTFAEMRKDAAFSPIVENFRITVSTQFFIQAAAADSGQEAGRVLQYFTCSAPQDVPTTLAGMISTSEAGPFLRLKKALHAAIPAGWENFDSIVTSGLATFSTKDAVLGIRAVLQPRGVRNDTTGLAIAEALVNEVGNTALKKLGSSGLEENKQWPEAGVLAAVGIMGSGPTLESELEATRLRIERSPAPELLDAMADALSEFDLSRKVLATDFSKALAAPLLKTILSKSRFNELDPQTVMNRYPAFAPDLQKQLIQSATGSAEFLHFFTEGEWDTYYDEWSPFVTAWLKALQGPAQEDVGLVLDQIFEEGPIEVETPTMELLSVVIDVTGIAWLPLDQTTGLLSEIDQELASVSPTVSDKAGLEKIKKHLQRRIALGDRTVQQLLETAETEAPSNRDQMRELAIHRARADYAAAPDENREEALLAWGNALLWRARRGPWSAAKPLAERAKQIFEEAGLP